MNKVINCFILFIIIIIFYRYNKNNNIIYIKNNIDNNSNKSKNNNLVIYNGDTPALRGYINDYKLKSINIYCRNNRK